MISVRNICHTYSSFPEHEVLRNVSIEIPSGKFVVLLGQSGSGKTTLLNIIAGLMKPTSGSVVIEEESIYEKKTKELSQFRSMNVGFVFQNYFLENCYTAYENVMVPLLLNKQIDKVERSMRVEKMLEQVGLKGKGNKKPLELSGGECQRVSIARALINEPKLLIADEPTGNLDSVNGDRIMEILHKETENNKTVLLVTHNEKYVSYADVVFEIKDGQIK